MVGGGGHSAHRDQSRPSGCCLRPYPSPTREVGALVSADRALPRGGEGGPGQAEIGDQSLSWWTRPEPTGPVPCAGGVGTPMLIEVASSVVWSLAIAPLAEMKVPAVTSDAGALELDPVEAKVVEPETSMVCQKPCSSAIVMVEPLTVSTVPASRGSTRCTLAASLALEVAATTNT